MATVTWIPEYKPRKPWEPEEVAYFRSECGRYTVAKVIACGKAIYCAWFLTRNARGYVDYERSHILGTAATFKPAMHIAEKHAAQDQSVVDVPASPLRGSTGSLGF